MSVTEASIYIGLSRDAVRLMVQQGRLPVVAGLGFVRKLMLDRTRLDVLLAGQ